MLAGVSLQGVAQRRPQRTNDAQVQQILRRMENRADRFRNSLDDALDQSRLNGTREEDEVNNYVQQFEEATDRLRERFNQRQSTSTEVQEVFDRAINIDDFMRRNRLTPRAERDWALIRSDLNQLGLAYNVAYRRGK